MDLIKQFSDDIGILFGYDKCGVLFLRNGTVSPTMMLEEILHLDSDEEYKYLRILESSDFLAQTVKDNTIKECLSRVRNILKTNLTGHNTMTAICAYTSIRKLLTAKGFHHPNANAHQLHLHWNLGGRVLTGLEDTYVNECTSLAQYI
eukprot:3379342-Ditylum_brightwellii.AAC.1